MHTKKDLLFSAALLLGIACVSVTQAQQRVWGVSVDGELFSMNPDGSDVISASSFGVDEYGYNVAGFAESLRGESAYHTNLAFTTRNSNDWAGEEVFGKLVLIGPSGLKKSNYLRKGQGVSAHGVVEGLYASWHTAYVGPENKWAGFSIMLPGTPDGWYEIRRKPNADYSKEYCLTGLGEYIYGVSRGDANSNGFIYRMEESNLYYGNPEKIFFFNNAADGLRPTGRLSVGQGNTLFGYTLKGGVNDKGVFYKINGDGTGYQKLFDLANKALTKTEPDGKYQTLLDVIAEGYIPATDNEGNYFINDATGIYRIAPTGYLLSKISSINADRIAVISPRYQHRVKVANINNGATDVPGDVILQVNEFTGSNGYQLQLSTSADFTTGVTTLESEDNVFTANDLGGGTTYYTRARAKSWPYYGDVISFTTENPVVDNTVRIYGQSTAPFSITTSGSDKHVYKDNYSSLNGYAVVKQLSNGDKLVISPEYYEEDEWNYMTLFRLTPDGLQKLFMLDYMEEEFLASTMVEGDDGWIYTAGFSIMGPQFVGFTRFKPDGSAREEVAAGHPDFLVSTKLVKTPDGIFGVASGRQANQGFIFKIRDDFSGMDIVHQFTNPSVEGARPKGQMVYYNGWLYGTAWVAGANAAGTIFKMRTSGEDFTVLHHFSPTFGKNPVGLVQDSNGVLYGATELGGKNGKGIIYKINPDGTGFTKVYEYWTHFTGNVNSKCELAVDDNYIYSLTDHESLFRINKDGSGYFSYGEGSATVDLYPSTPTNAHVVTPANLSDNVHINADIVVSEITGAASYTLQYSKFSDFSNATTLTSDTTVFTGISLLHGTTYFVRVRTSLSPAWGATTSFATASAQALTKLISPADGRVDVGVFDFEDEIASPLITMIIQPLDGAQNYRLQVSEDSIFQRVFYDNEQYGGNNRFDSNGELKYYGQWVYVRAKTDLSTEWGPTTRFRIIEYPEFPSECEYTIVPNPTSNAFTMAYTGNIRGIYVRDFVGSVVYKNETPSDVEPIRFGESLRPGIYILTVVTDSGQTVTRLVKE